MFSNFQTNYDKALSHIQFVLDTPEGAYNYEQALLAKWMLTSGINPYEYLPGEWAGALSCAQSFEALLHTIHHAMYDDGDISFITVNGAPRIVFLCPSAEAFYELALCPQERHMKKENYTFHIEFLPLDVQNFIDTNVRFEKEQEERWAVVREKMDTWRERGIL